MKKVISVTIGKVVFNIEEDAFEKLNQYLNSVKELFLKDKEKEEILEDIEISIAEKFISLKQRKTEAITLQNVEKVIQQMGTIKDFREMDGEEVDENEEKLTKKLYRDTDDQIIAGVASGLAAYLGVETVIIRLLFLISLFFGGIGAVIYILFWILVPSAKTTAQKLEMRGERITLKEIEKSVKTGVENLKKKDFGKVRNLIESFFRIFGTIFGKLLKLATTLFGIILMISGISVIFFLGFAIAWIISGGPLPGTIYSVPDIIPLTGSWYFLYLLSIYLLILIPFTLIFGLGLSLVKKRLLLKSSHLVILVGVWFAALGIFGAITFQNFPHIQEKIENINNTNPSSEELSP